LAYGKYWVKIEDINALVEPLPLVPAMWMAFRSLRSDGCVVSQRVTFRVIAARRGSHLVSYPAAPFNHFRYGIFVHAPPGFADGVDGGKIALQCIEGPDSVLSRAVSKLCCTGMVKADLRRRSEPSSLRWWNRVLYGGKGKGL